MILRTDLNKSNKWLAWTTEAKEVLLDSKIFSVNRVKASTIYGSKQSGRFYTLDCSRWVNIIALTKNSDVVLVEQYRHGIGGLTLELPGGSVENSDSNELTAAKRELLEETGCVSNSWQFLGKNHPNPALQNNFCYTFLAEGVEQIEEPKFDSTGTERINVRYFKLQDINALIRAGAISHALVIAAFHFLSLSKRD